MGNSKPTTILGVTNVYPNQNQSELGIFVHSLFHSFRSLGVNTKVIAPYSKTSALFSTIRKAGTSTLTKYEKDVYRPSFWSLPTQPLWSQISSRMNLHNFKVAVSKCSALFRSRPDWVYSHFLYSGWASIDLCDQNQIPCFVSLGESNLEAVEHFFGKKAFKEFLNRFTGIIAVSKENEDFCLSRSPELGDRILYLPNAVNTSIFKPHDRKSARKKLGLPENEKVVIFCGHFIERKGPHRVLAAINMLEGVKGIFIGRGQIPLSGNKVLHTGPVENNQMPLWYSAADVFVLPSTAEGMSNAIIEALACGLPVVVSDRKFNRDFLSEKTASFIDPLDESEIARAINNILENPLKHQQMTVEAVKKAGQFTLTDRANSILQFVDRCRNSS